MAAEHAAATLVEAVTGLAVAVAEEAEEEAVVAAVAAKFWMLPVPALAQAQM